MLGKNKRYHKNSLLKKARPAGKRLVFVPLPYKKQPTKPGSSQHICKSKEMSSSVIPDSILMFRTNFFMHKIIRLLDTSICLLPFGFSTILYQNCYKTCKYFCINCEYLAQLQLLNAKSFHLHICFRYCMIKVKHT